VGWRVRVENRTLLHVMLLLVVVLPLLEWAV